MYKIDCNKYFGLLTWDVICWGIEKDFIGSHTAIDYANEVIENMEAKDASVIVELLILETINKNEVLPLVYRLITEEEKQEIDAMKRLRYIVLDEIRKNEQGRELLSKAEEVFADFGYPSDMNSFIGYMPIENSDYNPDEHTQEENECRLIEELDSFLEREKRQWVGQFK